MAVSMKGVIALAMAAVAVGQEHTGDIITSPDMGPAAFLWPADRVWSGDMDNQAPCGSRAGAGNRTNFPLG
jgi:hypothetical protein